MPTSRSNAATIQRVPGLTDAEGRPQEWTIRTVHHTGVPMAEDERPRFYSRAAARSEARWLREGR